MLSKKLGNAGTEGVLIYKWLCACMYGPLSLVGMDSAWGSIKACTKFCSEAIFAQASFAPAAHCHGSRTLRFMWRSYNKLDFLSLVCMHITLLYLKIIEAQPVCKDAASTSAKGAEKCGAFSLQPGMGQEPLWSVSSCLIGSSEHTHSCVCVWVCVYICMHECVWNKKRRRDEVKWGQTSEDLGVHQVF